MLFITVNWAAGLISIGSLAGLTSVLLVLEMAATRILYAMSRDHFISKRFQKIHPKFKTPALLTWTVGDFCCCRNFNFGFECSCRTL